MHCQVIEPQDITSPQACAFTLKGDGGSITGAHDLEGFCVSDRPKHDSRWPQVGQTFTKPRHGNACSNARRCNSDNPWDWPRRQVWGLGNKNVYPLRRGETSLTQIWVGVAFG